MIIHKAYRYEVEPTVGQLDRCRKAVGTARFVYNWGLARRITEYQTTGKSSNAIAQHRQLNALKDSDFPWMREVSKCAPQEALRNLDAAYQGFFRRVKAGQKPGFPKFKKKGVSRDSCRFTGTIEVMHRKIQIPKLGRLRTKETTEQFEGRILNATLSRDADRWFVSLAVEVDIPEPKPVVGPVVGVDLGINTFAVLSNGTCVEAPKPLKHVQDLLARRQRQHARKHNGSANRRKSVMCLARLHRRVKNVRNDFIHKLTTNLAKTKSVIVVEDLSVRNMMGNRGLARSIADAGWGEFRRQLAYKTAWYGSRLVVAPKFFPSSKTCGQCGHVKFSLPLSERTFTCDACGLEIDRDLNAAQNLEQLVTRSSRESNACGDCVRPRPAHRLRRRSLKQELALSEMTMV
jgi:putative transposase